MPKNRRNSVRSFALLAAATTLTTLGAGLTSPARAAAATSPATSSAGSSSAAVSPRVGPPTDRKLKAALLGEKDLPPGYQSLGDPSITTLQVAAKSDLCDEMRANATPGRMVKVRTASVTFLKAPKGPALVEMLSVTGAAQARAAVAGVKAAPRRCPVIRPGAPGEPVTTVKAAPVPRLGDRAAGIRIEAVEPASKSRLRGTVIVIAHGDLMLVLSIAGGSDDDRRTLEKIATVAERKLRAATDRR
jgi:hypothetical protein